MFKRTILALSVTALTTFGGVAQAQENATLVLRSGDRISGQLVDLGGVGFTLSVNGQQRQIAVREVAVIDFTGSAMTDADWAKVPSGQPVVWLKNGEFVNGQLYDIGGTTPLRLTFKTNSGEREFSSSEVGRVVLARPATAVATSGTAPSTISTPSGPGIEVRGNQQWTSTGIAVRKGDRITLSTTGEVQLSTDASDIASATGSRSQRYAAGAPLPRVLAGALIGRIGNGTPFGIGTTTSIVAPDTGQLFLGINDDDVNDNHGGFRVQVTSSGSRR